MTRSDPGWRRRHLPQRLQFDFELVRVGVGRDRGHAARDFLLIDGRQARRWARGVIAGVGAVILERHLDLPGLGSRQRFAEECFSIRVIKVLAAQAVNTAHDQGFVVRVLLQGSANFEGQVTALSAIRITAVADDNGANVL